MALAPLARIAVRYVVGFVAGPTAVAVVLGDPDLMHYVTLGLTVAVGAATEIVYALARRRGWAT